MKQKFFLLLILIGAVIGTTTAKDLYNHSNPLFIVKSVSPEATYPVNSILIVPINQEAAIKAAYPTNLVLTSYEFNVGTAAGSVIAAVEFENDSVMLRFNGSGAVDSYGYTAVEGASTTQKDTVPWFDIAPFIEHVVVGENITKLGSYVLYDLSPYCSITLPTTLKTIFASSFPANFSGQLIVRNPTAPKVTEDKADAVDFKSIRLFVPVGSQSDYENATWWENFTSITEKNKIVVVVPTSNVYNTQVTFCCEVVSNADKYVIKIWNAATSAILFVFETYYDSTDNKWILTKAPQTTGPSNKPGLRRDTVRGTTESMQIDITGLSAGTDYGYSIAAMSGSAEVSKISGKFSTPNNKPTDIDNTIIDERLMINGRYNLLGLPVDENYRGVVIEGNKKTLQLR